MVIDTINKYSNITRFINDNYGWYGESNGNLRYFYEYILDHKDEMEKILDVLEKIKKLGFEKFEFNENLDFSKESYGINPSFERNYEFNYVANANVIPDYVGYINYKTEDSNYKMILHIHGTKTYGYKIILNSLLFDPRSLPKSISREDTFDYILKLKNEQKEQSSIIKKSVNLSISILDLENQLNSTNREIKRLDGIKNKDEIIAILSSIKEDIEKLKNLSMEYDNTISEQDSLLTPEVLEKEKRLYLKRRYWNDID